MLKHHLKKYVPDRKKIVEHKYLKVFGTLIHNPGLWHFNRYSVATAFSVGIFFCWVPVPFQMVLAAGAAILFHCNLALSVVLVWITNPATMPPIYYFAYKVGAYLMGIPPGTFNFELSIDWFTSTVQDIWQPLLLGCFICGVITAALSNIIIRVIWRYFTIKSWNSRKQRRKLKQE